MTNLRKNVIKRPRILEVLYSFRVGGSELLGLELARELSAAGAEVMCTALDGMQGPLRDRCAEYEIPVVDLGLPKSGFLSRNGFSLKLVRGLRELRIDTIHLQHFLGLNKLGLPARLAGIERVIVTEHSTLDASQSFLGRTRIRINWRLADAITVIHPSIKDYLAQSLGIDPVRVSVIPVGVRLQQWHRLDRNACRARLRLDNRFVFVFAGRMASVKNIPGLITSFLSMQSNAGAPGQLLLVGDGEDMAQCREIAGRHPHGATVTFVGEQSDIRPFLAAADAFVMNSISEGTPRALLEAMAIGLPGICPAVGGIPSILEGRGWLTEPGNSDSLASAMLDALRSPGKVQLFGDLAQTYVAQNYDSQQILLSYQRLMAVGDTPPASR